MKIVRQGDILFRQVSKEAVIYGENVGKVYTVAEGEKTGHLHRLTAPSGIFLSYGLGSRRLALPAGGSVGHDEHKPVELEPGTWEVTQERTWDYLREAVDDSVD